MQIAVPAQWANASPLSATLRVPTSAVLNHLEHFAGANYSFDWTLNTRDHSVIYKANSKFRSDPYTGALSAIDYLLCRTGPTVEDRHSNLVLAWGDWEVSGSGDLLCRPGVQRSGIQDFVSKVLASENRSRKNLLSFDYASLRPSEISRYYMQVRFGTSFTKPKEIRIYSHFADVILFHDGALWRDG
jgi:hypothetical protein